MHYKLLRRYGMWSIYGLACGKSLPTLGCARLGSRYLFGCENAVLFTSVFGYGPRANRHSVFRTKTSVNKTHFPSPPVGNIHTILLTTHTFPNPDASLRAAVPGFVVSWLRVTLPGCLKRSLTTQFDLFSRCSPTRKAPRATGRKIAAFVSLLERVPVLSASRSHTTTAKKSETHLLSIDCSWSLSDPVDDVGLRIA